MKKLNKIILGLKLKYTVFKKLIKSNNFVFIDFIKQNKENGYTEGFFSAGFTGKQINSIMDLAQRTHLDNMTSDVFESIEEEVKKLINQS